MKVNFLGDSITEGIGALTKENMFTNIISKELKCTVNNYGICATRIAKQINKKDPIDFDLDFVTRYKTMDKTADLVFVFGGTNDYGHGDAKLGSFDNYDEYTFYGALRSLIEGLIKIYTVKKLCFILPLHRYNENNLYGDGSKKEEIATLQTYVKIMREVLNYYKVEYLCLDEYFPEPLSPSDGELTNDGVHPNPKGNRLIADILIKYIKKKIKEV